MNINEIMFERLSQGNPQVIILNQISIYHYYYYYYYLVYVIVIEHF